MSLSLTFLKILQFKYSVPVNLRSSVSETGSDKDYQLCQIYSYVRQVIKPSSAIYIKICSTGQPQNPFCWRDRQVCGSRIINIRPEYSRNNSHRDRSAFITSRYTADYIPYSMFNIKLLASLLKFMIAPWKYFWLQITDSAKTLDRWFQHRHRSQSVNYDGVVCKMNGVNICI